jgi:hypothetical protein
VHHVTGSIAMLAKGGPLSCSVLPLAVIIDRWGFCQVDPVQLTRMAIAVQPMEKR